MYILKNVLWCEMWGVAAPTVNILTCIEDFRILRIFSKIQQWLNYRWWENIVLLPQVQHSDNLTLETQTNGNILVGVPGDDWGLEIKSKN